jgi:isoquinoline 1-oxidoreductase beta subunit
MSAIINFSRREFLKAGALAGGGLILGVHLPGLDCRGQVDSPSLSFMPNAWIRIGKDDTVTVIVNHTELGQGPYTSFAMIVGDELEADWSKIRVESAPVDPVYNHAVFGIQMTGGSTSTWTEYERLRKAGAAARQMLLTAAAGMWNVEPATCRAENGLIVHPESERRVTYGKLVDKASELTPPENPPLKDRKDFRFIGKPTKRLDTPDKTNGKAVFGLDASVPGMLVALVARAPVFGAKLKEFSDQQARMVPGVRHILKIERGVAVVADGFWPAKRAREALQLTWDEGPLVRLSSPEQSDEYAGLAKKGGVVTRNEGDATKALGGPVTKLEATYDLPYLAHATMEPMNCLADVRDDACEIWVGTQFQTVDRDAAAKDAGLKPEQVKLHTMLCGGGFGRRAVPDSHFVREAVQISKAIRKPVKVVWTREDDMQGGWYRPRAYHSVSGAVDAQGQPVAWQHRVVCQSIVKGTPFAEKIMKEGVDETAVEGAKDLPYDIPNLLVEWQEAPDGVPVLWWRSVGHSHTAFVVETFIDELARAAKKDPFEFRRGLLGKNPRHRRVLETVAEKAGWGNSLPYGRGRGIALHESFGSFVAHVAEVSVSKSGMPRVHRIVAAIDCGPVVNPATIHAQLEGGAVFGLTAAFYGQITFTGGRVQQRNFHDYRMLRMDEMPIIETHIVPSEEKMGGVGEPGVPCVAPAVANAIFAATGKRIRSLPIRTEALKEASA